MHLVGSIVIFVGAVCAMLVPSMTGSMTGSMSVTAPSEPPEPEEPMLEFVGIVCPGNQDPTSFSLTGWANHTGTMTWKAKAGPWQSTQCSAEFNGSPIRPGEFITVCAVAESLPATDWTFPLPRKAVRFVPSTGGAGSCEFMGPNGYLCHRAIVPGDFDPTSSTLTIGYHYGNEGRKPNAYPDGGPATTYSWKLCIAELNSYQLDTECASVAPICCGSSCCGTPPCPQ